MPLPLVPLLALGGFGATVGGNLYSQYKQRQVYRYQMKGQERWYNDWKKNTGLEMRYPEMSAPGHIRALQAGIGQSYGSSLASIGSYIGGAAYTRSRSLYNAPRHGTRRM